MKINFTKFNKHFYTINKTFTFKLFLLLLIFFISGFFSNSIYSQQKKDLKLNTLKISNLKTGYGAKSVIISPDNKYVFSINLEAMNVYIFNRQSKQLLYKLQFIAHPGKGYNYSTHKWINSYQEKPVEAHFTHNGRLLWVSLHNAGGIVLIDLKQLQLYDNILKYTDNSSSNNNSNQTNNNSTTKENNTNNGDEKNSTQSSDSKSNETNKNLTKTNNNIIDTKYNINKLAYFYNLTQKTKIKVKLPFFKTGLTPKIITSTTDNHFLFIANWHSATVSVFDISSNKISNFKKIKDIKGARIPRGLVVSPDNKKLYIADMGSNLIYIYTIPEFKKIGYIKVPVNPRHMVIDGNIMYTSININSKIVKIDLSSNKVILSSNTKKSARTVALSKDKKIIFVTCYRGNYVQAFRTSDLKLIAEWKSYKGPVGIDIFQKKDYIELWIVNYSTGILKVIELKEVFDNNNN